MIFGSELLRHQTSHVCDLLKGGVILVVLVDRTLTVKESRFVSGWGFVAYFLEVCELRGVAGRDKIDTATGVCDFTSAVVAMVFISRR